MKLPITGSILRKVLIIIPVVLTVILISLFLPAQRVTIEGFASLLFGHVYCPKGVIDEVT